jgi:hypothetical protein
LNNCILTSNTVQGASSLGGGGAYQATLNNCTLTCNTSYWGGGAHLCKLSSCLLTGNTALGGGGACDGMVNNCTLVGNSASLGGGGVAVAIVNNCIAYYNTCSTNGANWDPGTQLNWCCTTPSPTNGIGSITNEPLFIDLAGGNLRLQSNSPCINAGSNGYLTNYICYPPPCTWSTNQFDMDGNPRCVSGTVDIGAYEYQGTGSVISYAWLQYYGLPADGSADFIDSDSDGMNNWQEWVCGTNPTNALSVLQMLSPSNSLSGITVPWQSVSGITYFLQRSTDLGAVPAFVSLQTNLVGQAGTTTYTDTNAIGPGPFFYRVGVVHP